MAYPHMLIEDVSLRIMPIGGRSEGPFSVSIAPESEQVGQVIAAGISRRGSSGSREYLARATSDFFRDCAQTIMAFGEAIYEIVYLLDPEKEIAVSFELEFVQPRTVERRWGKLVQYVPADVAAEREVSQYVELSPERVLMFRPPQYVWGTLERMMESLGVLSAPGVPDFALGQAGEGRPKIPFDIEVYQRTQKLALARATREIGWNGRGLLQEPTSEYYSLHRELSFERFLINLRNEILSTLNEGLASAGHELSFSAQLVIEGLPTLGDVDAAQVALASGSRPFKDIMEPFLRRF